MLRLTGCVIGSEEVTCSTGRNKLDGINNAVFGVLILIFFPFPLRLANFVMGNSDFVCSGSQVA